MVNAQQPDSPQIGEAGLETWVIGPHNSDLRRVDPLDPALTKSEGCVRWVRSTDADAFIRHAESLGIELHKHTTHLESLKEPTAAHRPYAHVQKVDDSWLLIIVPTLWFTESDYAVHTGDLACLLGPQTVVTLEVGEANVQGSAFDRLATHKGQKGTPAQRLFTAVLQSVVLSAADVELALGDAVAEMERVVFGGKTKDPVAAIYGLKREITEARRALLPVSVEIPEILEPETSKLIPVDRRTLERVVATVERVDRHLDSHDSLLSDMLQVHLSQVSVRQNDDMRKMSAWAAIAVLPTIVSGIYGMNFDAIPGKSWFWGFPVCIAIIVIGCTALYRAFKKVGWM